MKHVIQQRSAQADAQREANAIELEFLGQLSAHGVNLTQYVQPSQRLLLYVLSAAVGSRLRLSHRSPVVTS